MEDGVSSVFKRSLLNSGHCVLGRFLKALASVISVCHSHVVLVSSVNIAVCRIKWACIFVLF